MKLRYPLILVSLISICSYPVYPHSGRTDARGGHYDRETGTYHYHNSGYAQTEDWGTETDTTAETVAEPVNIQKLATDDALSHLYFDANIDVTWYATGFFLNVFGVGTAYFLTPDVPATNLVGKTPAYVETYTRVYQSEVRKHRLNKAAQGCLASSLMLFYYYRLKTGREFF